VRKRVSSIDTSATSLKIGQIDTGWVDHTMVALIKRHSSNREGGERGEEISKRLIGNNGIDMPCGKGLKR
jgi:hypothetical protein